MDNKIIAVVSGGVLQSVYASPKLAKQKIKIEVIDVDNLEAEDMKILQISNHIVARTNGMKEIY